MFHFDISNAARKNCDFIGRNLNFTIFSGAKKSSGVQAFGRQTTVRQGRKTFIGSTFFYQFFLPLPGRIFLSLNSDIRFTSNRCKILILVP